MSPQYTPLEEHLLAAVECADIGDVDAAAEHLRHAMGIDPRPSLDRALRELEESVDPTMVDLRQLLADDLAAFPSGVEAGSALGALDDDFFGAELVIEAPVDGDDARRPITDEIPELDLDDLALDDAHGDAGTDQSDIDALPSFDLEPADDELQGFDLDDLIDTEALDRHTGDHAATDEDLDDLGFATDPPFSGSDRDDTLGGIATAPDPVTDTGSVTVPVPLFEDDDEPGVLDEPQTAPGGDELDVFAAGEFAFYDEPEAGDASAAADTRSDDLGSDNRAALAAGARYHAEAPPPPTHRRRSSPVDTHAGVEPRSPAPQVIDDEDDDDSWVLGFGVSTTDADHNAVEVDSADPDAFARAISGMHPPSERQPDHGSGAPGPSDAAATVETDVVDAPLPPPRKRRSGQHRGTSLSTRPVPLVEDEDVHPSGASAMTGAPASGSPKVATAPGMRAYESPELALAMARTLRDRGDIASAIQTVDALLANEPNDHRAHALRKSLQRQLTALRMSQLEPLDRAPQLAGRPSGLTPRSMFLLTFVDGMSSLQDIIDLSGLPPAEAGELLLELLDAGAIALR